MVARLHLLQRTRTPLPFKPAEEPPNAALKTTRQQALATALLHAEHIQLAALSRTPLAGILAQNSHDYLAAWALLATWTCALVWPTPETAGRKPVSQSTSNSRNESPTLGPGPVAASNRVHSVPWRQCPPARPANPR